MIQAEFEEKSYEGPLYNQLERGNQFLFTPGQVMENTLGFDHGLFLAQAALWQTLGYKNPLQGAALAFYEWPPAWGPPEPSKQLPRFRLNLFLQAKRPAYHKRRPRALADKIDGPLWSFPISEGQQKLLEVLATKTEGRAHVSYAAAAFHTYADLFTYTKKRMVVQKSTFPSVDKLRDHDRWYYRTPGAQGVANPDPESIEEPGLLDRVRQLAFQTDALEGGNLTWLNTLADSVIESAATAETGLEGVGIHFFDDLLTLERIAERVGLEGPTLSYARINLFTNRFDLSWLVVADK